MVLWDGCKALVKEELEAVVVGLNDEGTAPKVWPPMSHSLNKANQLTFVCREGGMSRSYGSTEVSHWSFSLVIPLDVF
jgi:hypothetical protein